MEARHFQTIWLLAKGHSVGDVWEMTSFGRRWIEQLVARYNAEGPDALGDLRRRNGAPAPVLTPEVLAKLRFACKKRPTTAVCGRASSRGLSGARTGVGKSRRSTRLGGAEGLRHVIKTPRPKNPKSATPDEAAAFKKTLRHRRRGSPKASRAAGRGLRERRTSARAEAGDATRLETPVVSHELPDVFGGVEFRTLGGSGKMVMLAGRSSLSVICQPA